MKKIISVILAAVLFCNFYPMYGQAAEKDTIYFADGSYATVEIVNVESRTSGSKTGRKTYTYYNSDSVAQWKVSLTASFTYNGSSATCTDSDISVVLYNSNCYVISRSSGKENNIARGYATIGRRLLGVTVDEKSTSLTLTCDANGNLS